MIDRTQLNAMIAGYLKSHTINICPAGMKAYPWATDADWESAAERHHVAREMARLEPIEAPTIDRAANLISGEEHSQVYSYYLGEDEDTSDVTDLDKAAHEEWHHGKALDGEYEDYYPDPFYH